jgi:small subunit ribosomal protein S1
MTTNDSPGIGEDAPSAEKEAKGEEKRLSMEELLELEDLELDFPKQGEVRTGAIASISANEILVSIGAKSEGIIPSRELDQLSDEERAALEVGQEITVFVVGGENQSGTMVLSYTRSLEEEDWENAEELLKSKETYEGTLDGFNKGGLIVRMGRLRAFVPASQVSQARRMRYQGDTPEARWTDMVGESLIGRVIEVDRERRRLILSERAASQESREALKDRLLEEIAVGETRTGRVTSLAEFGAFVNINGADGLVHLSELSWERVDHPSELLAVGEEVDVKVISVDQERKRIGLSLRQLQEDPWEDYIGNYRVGQLIEGKISRLVKFGAFARLDEHIEGLVHISELSEDRIEHPKEVVDVDDEITLRIIKIEPERRRIGLSLRKVDSPAYSDIDWEMTLAEMDDDADSSAEADPGAELKEALGLDEDTPKATEDSADEGDDTAEEAAKEEDDAGEADAEETPADEVEVSADDAEEESTAEDAPADEAEEKEDTDAGEDES